MEHETKLNAFVGRMLGDLGGAFSVPMVRIGDRLGLYRTLQESGPTTARELARKAGIAERYAREWLSHQAASGYLDYDPAVSTFTLSPEQAMVLAQTDSPVYLQGAFDLAAVMLENEALVETAFRTGKGVGWGEQSPCLFCTVGRFFRPELPHRSRAVLAAGSARHRRRSWSAVRPWRMSAAGTASRP